MIDIKFLMIQLILFKVYSSKIHSPCMTGFTYTSISTIQNILHELVYLLEVTKSLKLNEKNICYNFSVDILNIHSLKDRILNSIKDICKESFFFFSFKV